MFPLFSLSTKSKNRKGHPLLSLRHQEALFWSCPPDERIPKKALFSSATLMVVGADDSFYYAPFPSLFYIYIYIYIYIRGCQQRSLSLCSYGQHKRLWWRFQSKSGPGNVRFLAGQPGWLKRWDLLCLVSQATVVAAMTVIFFLSDKRRIWAFLLRAIHFRAEVRLVFVLFCFGFFVCVLKCVFWEGSCICLVAEKMCRKIKWLWWHFPSKSDILKGPISWLGDPDCLWNGFLCPFFSHATAVAAIANTDLVWLRADLSPPWTRDVHLYLFIYLFIIVWLDVFRVLQRVLDLFPSK